MVSARQPRAGPERHGDGARSARRPANRRARQVAGDVHVLIRLERRCAARPDAPLRVLRIMARTESEGFPILFGHVPQPSRTEQGDLKTMASVHRRVTPAGSVVYRAIWKEPGLGGKLVQRSRNFDRAGDAKAHAARMEEEVEKRGVGDPQKHTLEVFLKRWLATLADRGEHSPTALAAYRWQADIACRHIGHIPLEKVSPGDLDQLYSVLLRRGGVARKPNAD